MKTTKPHTKQTKEKKPLPKMLVIRGVRESCLAFYNQFRRFNITYVSASENNFSTTIKKQSKNLTIVNSKYYPAYGFDPFTLLRGHVNNLSWQNIEGLEKLIKECDIVNLTDTYYCFNRQAAKLAEQYKKPVVTIIWTTIPHHISSWLPPYSQNVKKVIGTTDLFILRCKRAYLFTDSLGINRNKTIVSHKGVDLTHFYPQKKKKKKTVDILYVGNFHISKGLTDLIEAFKQLVTENYPARLFLAGSGNLYAYIKRNEKTLPIKNLGFVSYAKLGEVYRKTDIFCSPSKDINLLGVKIWEEYFSYTLMEAQASGLAIVATQCGGIPEEVDARNPLVPQKNVKELYKALKELVINKKKREFLQDINRKRAEKLFDARIQARKTEDAILNILR